MESQMDTELRFHIETFAEDLIRIGIPRQEALRRARIEFGGIERVKEEGREARGAKIMETRTYVHLCCSAFGGRCVCGVMGTGATRVACRSSGSAEVRMKAHIHINVGSLGARWGTLILWSLLDPLVQFDR
jgi:hypothetical protein